MKYCHNCGTPINESDLFCSKCGQPLRDDVSSTPPPLPPNNDSNVFSESIEAIRTLLRVIYRFISVLNIKGWVCWLVICIIEVLILSQLDLFYFLERYNNRVIILTGFTTIFGGYIYNLVRWILKKR